MYELHLHCCLVLYLDCLYNNTSFWLSLSTHEITYNMSTLSKRVRPLITLSFNHPKPTKGLDALWPAQPASLVDHADGGLLVKLTRRFGSGGVAFFLFGCNVVQHVHVIMCVCLVGEFDGVPCGWLQGSKFDWKSCPVKFDLQIIQILE